MKIGFTYVTLIFFWMVISFACSKSDDTLSEEVQDGFAKFSKTEIIVSGDGGQTSAMLVWDNAVWDIESLSEQDIITDISPSSGGELGSSGYNIIIFKLSENNLPSQRSQEVDIVNSETGEKHTLLITQESKPVTILESGIRFQKVIGFGGMYNPAIWMSSQNRIDSEELATMYDPAGNLQYSILRLMIYADKSKWAKDVEGALQAQNYGAIVFACPWDCTDELAEYVDVDGDGENDKHLPAGNYEAYANHLIEYVAFMKSKGVNIYALSLQNEPDMDFTVWTPEELATFTADFGAKIRASGVKLMSPEACGFSPEYTNAVLNSPKAFANTDIVAGHTYQGFTDLSSSYVKGRHDYISGIYPNYLAASGKTLWMTEKLFGSSGEDFESQDYKKWSYNLDNLGLEMHMCMEAYCSAYVYWYLKRFYGMIGDNDTRAYVAEGEVMKNGYIMGHYSAYATGMTRIQIDFSKEEILATAYVNEGGDILTLVALNMGETSFETWIKAPGKIKTHSAIETTVDYDMKNIETVLADEAKHLKLEISPRSIYSLKIKL